MRNGTQDQTPIKGFNGVETPYNAATQIKNTSPFTFAISNPNADQVRCIMTLPALTNEAIMILKASSLVSVVGVVELTRMAQDLAASTFQPLPLFAAAGLIYLVINTVVARFAAALERRFRWGRA